MYRHSPVRNQRSKGIKIKHVVQLCLLIVVCFWLIFQVKRSHDNKKHFDAKLSNAADEILKFGRKDLRPKLEETTQEQDDEDETKHEEDEDKIEEAEENDSGGGGGDDEIDENEQEKSSMEIDPDEVDIIDEDKETEEEKETEEKDGRTQIDDGSTEAREEHYKADDASSAVITHDVKNATLDVNSSDIIGNSENETVAIVQEKDFESKNATTSVDLEYGPPANTTSTSTGSSATVTETTQVLSNLTQNSEMLKSNGEENGSNKSKSENLDSSDPTHLEEKQVRNDLETLPEIETEAAAE